MLTQKQKNLFVSRQRIMLEKYELGVCAHCPKVAKYASEGGIIKSLFRASTCDFCAKFNGINPHTPTKYYYNNYRAFKSWCPCHNYPPEEAVKRAWAAVEKWEKENK